MRCLWLLVVYAAVIPECEVFYEEGPGADDLHKDCEKNPGHPSFIPVVEFTMEHLPQQWRTRENMEWIRHMCDMTFKVSVNYTSQHRPDTYPDSQAPFPYSQFKGNRRLKRSGTGYFDWLKVSNTLQIVRNQPCPCILCKQSGQPKMKYLQTTIETAAHVIYDDSEAVHATFEAFYDSGDRQGVKLLYGVSAEVSVNPNDCCSVICVTHDTDATEVLFVKMKKLILPFNIPMIGIVISHPHGSHKHITLGKYRYHRYSTDEAFPTNQVYTFESGDKCRLPLRRISRDFAIHTGITHLQQNLPVNENILSNKKTVLGAISALLLKPSGPEDDLSTESRESTPPCLNTEQALVRGVEYSLPPGSTFTLPIDSEYLFSCRYFTTWVNFPPGTRYTLPDGSDFNIPVDVLFCAKVVNDFKRSVRASYQVYDIDTCPGSSGAAVIYEKNKYKLRHARHAGALDDGTNRSGVGRYYVY